MKLNLPEQDQPAKIFNTLQYVVFLAMFIGIYLAARRYVHAWYLRLLCLLADYAVCALISYCILKPLSDRAAEGLRRKKGQSD